MRNLNNVIDELFAVSTDSNFKQNLTKIQSDLFYRPPEDMHKEWNEVSRLLVQYYPHPLDSKESLTLVSLFTTKPIKEIIEIYSEGI